MTCLGLLARSICSNHCFKDYGRFQFAVPSNFTRLLAMQNSMPQCWFVFVVAIIRFSSYNGLLLAIKSPWSQLLSTAENNVSTIFNLNSNAICVHVYKYWAFELSNKTIFPQLRLILSILLFLIIYRMLNYRISLGWLSRRQSRPDIELDSRPLYVSYLFRTNSVFWSLLCNYILKHCLQAVAILLTHVDDMN